MALANLTPEERKVVLECLNAAAMGPFFPDWEFQTLFGVERTDVKSVIDAWPSVDESDAIVDAAIANSMNHLLGYPHGHVRAWSQYISVTPKEVLRILQKWSGDDAV